MDNHIPMEEFPSAGVNADVLQGGGSKIKLEDKLMRDSGQLDGERLVSFRNRRESQAIPQVMVRAAPLRQDLFTKGSANRRGEIAFDGRPVKPEEVEDAGMLDARPCGVNEGDSQMLAATPNDDTDQRKQKRLSSTRQTSTISDRGSVGTNIRRPPVVAMASSRETVPINLDLEHWELARVVHAKWPETAQQGRSGIACALLVLRHLLSLMPAGHRQEFLRNLRPGQNPVLDQALVHGDDALLEFCNAENARFGKLGFMELMENEVMQKTVWSTERFDLFSNVSYRPRTETRWDHVPGALPQPAGQTGLVQWDGSDRSLTNIVAAHFGVFTDAGGNQLLRVAGVPIFIRMRYRSKNPTRSFRDLSRFEFRHPNSRFKEVAVFRCVAAVRLRDSPEKSDSARLYMADGSPFFPNDAAFPLSEKWQLPQRGQYMLYFCQTLIPFAPEEPQWSGKSQHPNADNFQLVSTLGTAALSALSSETISARSREGPRQDSPSPRIHEARLRIMREVGPLNPRSMPPAAMVREPRVLSDTKMTAVRGHRPHGDVGHDYRPSEPEFRGIPRGPRGLGQYSEPQFNQMGRYSQPQFNHLDRGFSRDERQPSPPPRPNQLAHGQYPEPRSHQMGRGFPREDGRQSPPLRPNQLSHGFEHRGSGQQGPAFHRDRLAQVSGQARPGMGDTSPGQPRPPPSTFGDEGTVFYPQRLAQVSGQVRPGMGDTSMGQPRPPPSTFGAVSAGTTGQHRPPPNTFGGFGYTGPTGQVRPLLPESPPSAYEEPAKSATAQEDSRYCDFI